MSLGKKDIVNNIKSKAHLSLNESKSFLEKFIILIKKGTKTKISGFGTFYIQTTAKRLGRNPKTKEEFIINPRSKLILKTSNSVKKILN